MIMNNNLYAEYTKSAVFKTQGWIFISFGLVFNYLYLWLLTFQILQVLN